MTDIIAEAEARRRAYYEEPVRFTVKGRCGTFPFDMLRHDRCYPATSDDAANLTYVFGGGSGRLAIELVAPKRSCITPGRWASFGWTVTDIGGEELF